MPANLGIEPTDRLDYYFVSYNTDDAERLAPVVRQLSHYNVPIWYDRGLKYGAKWEKEIADRIQSCMAVILFVTKGLFEKENPYVEIEYEMASKYFDKKVYVILIDQIQKEQIPNSKLGWWIQLGQNRQLDYTAYHDKSRFYHEITKMLNISNSGARLDALLREYQTFLQKGEIQKAGDLMKIILHGKELETKAGLVTRLFETGYAGISHQSVKNNQLISCRELRIGDMQFQALYRNVFHRVGFGDADVIDLFRNGEKLYTIGGLVDAYDGYLMYDREEDLLYILYLSCPNVGNEHPLACAEYMSVCIMEAPCEAAVCHDFRNPELMPGKIK